MTKIILLNGPMSSGKDTIASQLTNRTPKSLLVKFAAPLKTVAMHLYCNGDSRIFHEHDQPQNKNNPHPDFLGKSCRQVQIDISEVYAKKVHGTDVFGHFLVKKIEHETIEGYEAFFVSDSGFRPEAEVLIKEYGAQNVLLLRLHREGCEFQNDPSKPKYDSRNYINLDDLDVQSVDVTNHEGDINKTLDEVSAVVNQFLKGE